MTLDYVVDVGNTRVKMGRVVESNIVDVQVVTLHDLENFPKTDRSHWAIAGVVPTEVVAIENALRSQGNQVTRVTADSFARFNDFRTLVEEPDRIGVDRLLNAYAAYRQRAALTNSVVAISLGTAMTIDFVTSDGTHHGGVILPGKNLMARSLHQGTSQIPEVEVVVPPVARAYGVNTSDAVARGIYAALTGAAEKLLHEWANSQNQEIELFITGGDAELFVDFHPSGVSRVTLNPLLTLEGIYAVALSMLE